METHRTHLDPPRGHSDEPRFGKSRFEKSHREENSSDANQSVEEQIKRFKEALRNIGGCCDDTDCLGDM